jgi:hypothetical protein
VSHMVDGIMVVPMQERQEVREQGGAFQTSEGNDSED